MLNLKLTIMNNKEDYIEISDYERTHKEKLSRILSKDESESLNVLRKITVNIMGVEIPKYGIKISRHAETVHAIT